MERPKRHTKKYSFRQPDLKELRNLTSYVLDPLGFKARYGKLLPLLTTQVGEGLMSTLAQFYDPLYHCFSFPDFQLLPTLKEYAHLVGIPILDQGLPSDFLVAQAIIYGKAMSEDAFEAIFVLLIYGLMFAFKENKGCLRWSMRLMSLTNEDIFWYDRVYDTVQIIDYYGEFPNVPLLGTCGGISYNPILARRQLGFPLKDKPYNILLEGVFFQEGKDPQGLKAKMVRAWRKIHKKGRNELGPKNCIALEPYTSWVRQRASKYLLPYDYPRPTPLVVAGPSTLPNQGVEELRDEDLSRAWIREREELLQQLKEKDALIEFLEHQVIDDPNDTWTSLLPQSSKFWKRKYDRLAKEKADMEAAYEREIKKLCASRLPASRASRDP
ncbi:hypothetical protein KIW84_075449 [Lathyrus oleraceus]|uniref:DUF7745 domain-containing protein n=1 Tax=Pisum sativum TaxID=3888 RepID=A0A9D5A1X6_PEA|nr:hypothetical protein KIW84_075449 [Pisum sativum]